jgi:hypothetical protein
VYKFHIDDAINTKKRRLPALRVGRIMADAWNVTLGESPHQLRHRF